MQYKIENELIELIVDSQAAEMHSLKRKDDGIQRLWNGDPVYWSGRNPILFPMISSTPTHTVILKDKEYTWGNHGFARYKDFALVEKLDDSLTLCLNETIDNIYEEQYPYHFNLFVNYRLEGNSVVISYKIENHDEEVLPFGFGLHPAVIVDLNDDSYFIEMQQPELVNGEMTTKVNVAKNEELLFKTIKIENYKSSQTKLYNDKVCTTIRNDKFDFMAFWKKPGANFVCIEPWIHPSNEPVTAENFTTHPNTIRLEPNEVYTIDYSITLE